MQATDVADARIFRIPVPTPFAVGDINAYLVVDDPLTLIDNGPNIADSLQALEGGLESHGIQLADLELLILTHQHVDHLGLTSQIVARSGARVAALAELAPWVRDIAVSSEADMVYQAELLQEHGVSAELTADLRSVGVQSASLGSSFSIDLPLIDGDLVHLRDRKLRVLHRAGHSRSDTLFVDEQRGLMFGGDHLLKGGSINALLSINLDGTWPERRPKPLADYATALTETRSRDLQLVLTGHGDPVSNHLCVIDDSLERQRRRGERVLAALSDGPKCAYDVARTIWGSRNLIQAMMTVNEVLGQLDLLALTGAVHEQRVDNASVFALGSS